MHMQIHPGDLCVKYSPHTRFFEGSSSFGLTNITPYTGEIIDSSVLASMILIVRKKWIDRHRKPSAGFDL